MAARGPCICKIESRISGCRNRYSELFARSCQMPRTWLEVKARLMVVAGKACLRAASTPYIPRKPLCTVLPKSASTMADLPGQVLLCCNIIFMQVLSVKRAMIANMSRHRAIFWSGIKKSRTMKFDPGCPFLPLEGCLSLLPKKKRFQAGILTSGSSFFRAFPFEETVALCGACPRLQRRARSGL